MLKRLLILGLLVFPVADALGVGLPPATEWNRERAAHLLRRAGFCGTPAEIDRLAGMTVSQAVDDLVDYERIPQSDVDYVPVRGPDRRKMRQQLRELDNDKRREINQRLQRLDRLQIEELRAWWLRRMIVTPRPFEERMTLFWHGHFTSGHREVNSATMMADQNALLRKHALGDFRELLTAISQDPAMLRYLDNASNRKQAPNENFARELLELFTLGVGNYTETDIKEAARALTGWTLRGEEFRFVRKQHDEGEKTFLGRSGKFTGDEIIAIILEQPATARFLANNLLVYFVRDDPTAEHVDALAAVIRAERFNLREAMRALLKSEIFYDPEVMFSRVKSPVDLVVGTFRVLEVVPQDMYAATRALRGMGQELFQPPNVKGWDGGRKWLSTATVFTRYNFASGVLAGTKSRRGVPMMMGTNRRLDRLMRHRDEVCDNLDDYPGLVLPDVQVQPDLQSAFDPSKIVDSKHLSTADRVLNHMIERILQLKVDPRQRRFLRDLLTKGGRFDPDSADGKAKVVSLINALLTMPEYQVK